MTQFAFPTINPATHNGTQLAGWLNDLMPSLWSQHAGSSRPSYAAAGMLWMDDSGSDLVLNVFDGSADTPVARVASGVASVVSGGIVLDRSSGIPIISGRPAAATPTGADDALIIRARDTAGAQIALRGTGFTSPDANAIEITSGVSPSQFTWKFQADGTLLPPSGEMTLARTSGIPAISGRLAGASPSAGDDALTISARSGAAGGTIALRGTSFTTVPNSVRLTTGASGARKDFDFLAAGTVTWPTGGAGFTVNQDIYNIGGVANFELRRFGSPTNARYLVLNSGASISVSEANGNMNFQTGSVAFIIRASDLAVFASAAAGKPGGGPWSDSSDIRIKQDIQDYEAGLDQVLALRPRTWRFREETGRDTARRWYGLIAQEAEGPMPELVTVGRESVGEMEFEDMRTLDWGPMVFALVNAVKTLAGRVAALEEGQS